MKPTLIGIVALTLVVFAIQVIFDIVIFQITFGFAHETLTWRLFSAIVVGSIICAVAALVRKPQRAAN